ncbi:MAG: DUF1285 domain-containing protein [Alphaproteobacteria bacterium]|nr:DUF1285 domain-containing protein [Alphaproteobacteria bacterium]
MHNATALNEIISCDSDFRIARDGTWFYQGSPMARQAMVRLFSTILCRDEEGVFWLKTPVEKGRTICFKTNVNEWVALDNDHPLTMRNDTETGEVVPYIHVRDGLEAKLNRNSYYELAEYALAEGETQGKCRGITSAGEFFALETLS